MREELRGGFSATAPSPSVPTQTRNTRGGCTLAAGVNQREERARPLLAAAPATRTVRFSFLSLVPPPLSFHFSSETGSYCVIQVDLEFTEIHLLLLPESRLEVCPTTLGKGP